MGTSCQTACKAYYDQRQYKQSQNESTKQKQKQKQKEIEDQNTQLIKSLKHFPLDKIKKARVQVNQFPIPPQTIQNKIQKLSKYFKMIKEQKEKYQKVAQNNNSSLKISSFSPQPQIYKYKSPYNFFFMNIQQLQPQYTHSSTIIQSNADASPKGQCIIYKLNSNNEFGGYFQGYLKENLELDIDGCLIIFPNGSYFEGKPDNQGTYSNENTGLRYVGQWENQMPNREGKEKNNRGTYEGQYQKGQKYGKGKFVWNDQAYYQGMFKKGVFHGKGILHDKKIDYEYQGDFSNGQRHGKGIEKTKAETYQGEFMYGKRNGNGRLEVYEEFSENKLHQFVSGEQDVEKINNPIKKQPSKIYQGFFQNNQPHGKGILEIYQNDKIVEKIQGMWTRGQLTSVFEYSCIKKI